MSNLQNRQDKIKARRAKTNFRDYLMEIASRWTINLYRNNGMVSAFPNTPRSGKVVSLKQYQEKFESMMNDKDMGTNFLQSFTQLFIDQPKPAVIHLVPSENSDFCHCSFGTKNAYLTFVAGLQAKDIMYSTQTWANVTNIINSSLVFNNSSNIFQSRMVSNSFNIFYSQYIYNSNNMWFCSSCIGCHDCIESNNLENQSYYIKNIQYSKEDYLAHKDIYLPQQYSELCEQNFMQSGTNFICSDSTGDGMYRCTNVHNGFNTSNYVDSRNTTFSDGLNGSSNFYDCFDTGNNSHHFYGVCYGGEDSEHVYMGSLISHSNNIFYSYNLESCSFCLGCVGLRNKSYCILNKQYSKEEWYEKVDEIFGQMEKDGALGQFFPASMNPFYFNDTAAYLIDPSFTKEEVVARGYLWRDEPIKVDIPEGAQTVSVDELGQFESWRHPEGNEGTIIDSSLRSEGQKEEGKIWTIDESICKKVIIDHAGNAYRIIPMELEFLRKHGLPLPRKHWLDRMKENFRIS